MSFFLLLALISLIMIPIYILVINKPSSKAQDQSQALPQAEYIIPDMDPNQLGFIYSSTTNHVESPKKFLVVDALDMTYGNLVDTGVASASSKIQYKWVYDKTNIYTIERKILNTYNGYTQDELSELGKTSNPNTYLVNQIIPIYDVNNPILSKDITMEITPFILSTYENYKKLPNISE